MIRVLCYGDSNTWGTIPDCTYRHCNVEDAYPALLQKLLGKNYCVISEGLPARTAYCDDIKEFKGNRNGALYFPTSLITHDPLDYVVILLGTNDLKEKFDVTAQDVANAIKTEYIEKTRKYLVNVFEISKLPDFIVVCPPLVTDSKWSEYRGAKEKSLDFSKCFLAIASETNVYYIDNSELLCGKDGVHLTYGSHIVLAQKLYEIIKNSKKCKKIRKFSC